MAGYWTAENESYAVNYLQQQGGLTQTGAAALVSRWANVESSGAGINAVNPTSGAYGAAQWLGPRQTALFESGGASTLQGQLDFAIQELNTTEKAAGNVLRSTNDPQQAATGASMYERAEGYNAQTGTDNFTERTASGIPAILGGLQPGESVLTVGGTPTGSGGQLGTGNAGSSGSSTQQWTGLASIVTSGETWLSDWLTRGIVILLGLVFVAGAVFMFKPAQKLVLQTARRM